MGWDDAVRRYQRMRRLGAPAAPWRTMTTTNPRLRAVIDTQPHPNEIKRERLADVDAALVGWLREAYLLGA